MPESQRLLRVFLCHSSGDKTSVRELYQRLETEGWIDAWLDEEKLYPGQDWNYEIELAVEAADVILVCLTNNSVTKEGYVQRELRKILDQADNKPEGTLFIVPVRLEECEPPRRLRAWQYADYFPPSDRDEAYERLLVSLRKRADALRITAVHPARTPGEGSHSETQSNEKPVLKKTSAGTVQSRSEKGKPRTLADKVATHVPIWLLLLATILMIFLVASAVFFLVPIKVPQVTGFQENEATSILKGKFLRVGAIQEEYDTDIDPGRVIRTEPPINSEIKRGTPVDLFISKGACEVTLPQWNGVSEREAFNLLNELCQSDTCPEIQITLENSTTTASGLVVTSDPAPGAAVNCDTQVKLVIAAGDCQVSVPNLINLPETEARQKLENACQPSPCLNAVTQIQANASVPEGRVIQTDPAGNTNLHCGENVVLLISAGSQVDADLDGMPDLWEVEYGLNPDNRADATQDKDEDSLINIQEYENSTDPGTPDTDDDGMKDGEEVEYAFNPNQKDAAGDADNDCRSNASELREGTNPREAEPWQVPLITPGTSSEQARSRMNEACLTVASEEQESSSTIPTGAVIRTEPEGGQWVEPHQGISLVISSGIRYSPVPWVVGMQVDDALSTLQASGFCMRVLHFERPAVDFSVLDITGQSLRSGGAVEAGTNIFVSAVAADAAEFLSMVESNLRSKGFVFDSQYWTALTDWSRSMELTEREPQCTGSAPVHHEHAHPHPHGPDEHHHHPHSHPHPPGSDHHHTY